MKQFHAKNEAETKALAEKLAQYLEPGDVILLEGNLGAGKTTFTKGLAAGLGIGQVIKSPTYTIIREYTKGRLPLYHMDVYRLEETGGADMGLEEYFEGEGVSVIEWATFIAEDLPNNYLTVRLTTSGEKLDERDIELEATGERYVHLLSKLNETMQELGKDE